MRTRPLGSHGPQLTLVGLGTWAIGGDGWIGSWGPQDDDDSIATIRRALDEGVNWIDTAEVYGLGHSESVVGRAIAGRRDDVIVATKCVRRFNEEGPFTSGSAQGVIDDCEASLKRLGVDHIDLYQIHHPPQDVPVEEPWTAMVKLAEQGKIRYLGVSNLTVDEVARCMAIRHVDSHQPSYSLLNRDIEVELLPYCKDNGIGVVSYGAMAQGLLSGTFDPSKLKGDDWRQRADFQARVPEALETVRKLEPIASKRGLTVGQLVIQWVLEHPAITSAIVGARRPQQAAANIVDEPDGNVRSDVEQALT